ncbi:PREDICTED: protein IQ-DOMAIN 14-like isoform X2 [Tarenaya hassleriana]|uniref:protein IQ-DOMAIN 14-like isoform X2 n=1 Tax=Tarenaya hassleriana TaxID=28532 RepID=UPI00053C9A99|nr:PREDICTED: protein IQ-DOMAIN 14-like isoform X2 [Tarenaya hassleriana]
MAKKKGLFTLLKRIFVSEANPEKKEKRRRWAFWKLKVKKRLPSITAPPRDRTGSEAQDKNTVTRVGEVKQLSCSPQLNVKKRLEEDSEAKTENDITDPQPEDQIFKKGQIEELAAIRIQTAFRGYLARKALRALKGIVKLQAYIRGRAVRRQAMTTLKCLQSVVNIQSQVCAKRTQIPGSALKHYEESKEFQMFKDKIIKVDTDSQKRWDDSLMTKEVAETLVMSKKEAALRRERIREYAVTHRKSAESYQKRHNTRWKYWLDQWVDTQLTKSKELEDLDFSSNTKPKDETFRDKQLKTPRNSSPRRSINHRRQVSVGEDDQSPALPSPAVATRTYMAATESAKAKARSLSSPRVRPGSFDTQSESYSPYKNKLCLSSSIMSDAPSRVRVHKNGSNVNRPSGYQQRSPGLRGFNAGPVNDLSINSERSLPSWNRQSSFR